MDDPHYYRVFSVPSDRRCPVYTYVVMLNRARAKHHDPYCNCISGIYRVIYCVAFGFSSLTARLASAPIFAIFFVLFSLFN